MAYSALFWLEVSFSATILVMKVGISAVVVVHDQVDLLQKCLASVEKWVDEIIIIDLESKGDIKSVATKFNAKYYSHKLVSIVEAVRQESLKYATYEYVLFIDPDETMPTSLATDLVKKIKSGEYDYFVTPRQNYVFGKLLQYSRWWPDPQTRIFRYNKVVWGKALHQEVVSTGVGYSYPDDKAFAIHHDNYRTIDEFISKNMRYAKADAQGRVDSNDPLTLSHAMRLSVSEFISRFFEGHGYKDGMHGLVLGILQSFYYFMVYTYYWEAVGYKDLETKDTIMSFPRTWFSHGFSESMYWDKAKSPLKIIKEKLVRRMIG